MPDGHEPARATFGDLPRWRLDDLYASPEDPALDADVARARSDAQAFAARYEGKLAALTPAGLADAIEAFERLEELMGRVGSYIGLMHVTRLDQAEAGRRYQTISERLTEISSLLLFFTLEFNRLDEALLEAGYAAEPRLARYRPWADQQRAFRPHQLEDRLEKLLLEKSVSGRAAWVRLFDESWAAARFTIDGEELTSDAVLSRLSDRDPERRRKAAAAFSAGLADRVPMLTLIYNTVVKDKEVEDRWRGFGRPISSRNLSNQVEDEVVDALIKAVREAYPRISHRYYALKARLLGVETMNFWDRNAAYPQDSDAHIPWSRAQDIVLGAFGGFMPEMADIAGRFFTENWIDAPVAPGKAGGAFSHPTVPSAHPYVLMNYQGKARDVMTLAHELGHGVHQTLAADQGLFLADTPLTLAETASVFGEMLTFRALLDAETDPERRRLMLASKIEDIINTVVRQIAFATFEMKVHDARREGELTPDVLGRLWFEVQTESLGPAFTFSDDYRNWWAYIPHFFHTPFYVYAYAFGECLVHALYAVHEQGDPDFAAKYRTLLATGGAKGHRELLAPFGLDAGDPAFWSRGLALIEGYIDRLEEEVAAAGL
ncbi:oligoendopeptidase F [Tistrella bauzanensis]|uniref:Oligoendopeptidase F n=1 Tax=Tistrella bauzanensis TaxID=657419 RepID=A0ABQ1I883_9PROT|nr:M3 family oligoendopeptidase [Tistrella bauzanensis]GGB23207.1 oligoendopeptidase F [Tistrella bauzanensis]